ncbi:LysR family transcriptional regulator [Herbaspirillum sp. RTI4]|uniref:LysR family transcriptional regulator n=1 Tax=Herbaspirillum sp. RTI4 TaxID=3048640 RepID=UPI002AB452EB|nr:LysR family transcriptional regulator [Herbaspirillum sp. RTI4]MDY7578395.1 LysR family transcriptional regulator [Herbaspirillum sp. RTI4]MEA9983064.1 LysR family transcriptional regulator [Herbaspirillum sp. RTI4]
MQSILEIRHLRTLLALRASGNLLRAATLLNLTQSALSHQLKQLEAHFGTSLFERKSQPVRFTAAGERLLKLADSVLPQIEDAERDLARLQQGVAGQLRIAVECHTCFDWLMPSMDVFRKSWPEVELDIVSGFQADPIGLLYERRADVAIVAEIDADETVDYHPLFQFEIVALLAHDHPLAGKDYLQAADFATDTLITYPVPDDMLDIVRQVLQPAGIQTARRTTELTVAMLQLVASRRGIATLPVWAAQNYLNRDYVLAKRITAQGLTGRLYAACQPELSALAYMQDFIATIRATSYLSLPNVELL